MILHLDNAALRKAAEQLYGQRPEDNRLHLFGVRSASPHGAQAVEVHAPAFNRYDDTAGVFGTAFRLFPATTDPGATWTNRPPNPRGAAHLVPGVYLYRLGLHKGRKALVQGGPVTVRRDRDRDGAAEAGEPVSTGWYGINIHSGGKAPTVDAWSAGCQVIPAASWPAFYALPATSGQSEFRYWLFEGAALVRVLS